jgi:multisubunit Na+/H+ antiporter MnhG subunit
MTTLKVIMIVVIAVLLTPVFAYSIGKWVTFGHYVGKEKLKNKSNERN